jgi:hypothetical protein
MESTEKSWIERMKESLQEFELLGNSLIEKVEVPILLSKDSKEEKEDKQEKKEKWIEEHIYVISPN